jgi:hypothetical protein
LGGGYPAPSPVLFISGDPIMTKIIRSKDCGNSPKNKFVEDVKIAFAKHNVKFLLNNLTDDIAWQIAGQKPIHGKNELVAAIQGTSQSSEVTEVAIHHVVTHGYAGAVNGLRKHRDGKTYDFCTIYVFSNSRREKVREITHYAIERIE